MEQEANHLGIRRSVLFWTAVTCHRFPTGIPMHRDQFQSAAKSAHSKSKSRPICVHPSLSVAKKIRVHFPSRAGALAKAERHSRKARLFCLLQVPVPQHRSNHSKPFQPIRGGVACLAFRIPSSALCKPASN